MTEYSAITLFNNEFGNDIKKRYEKLQEEIRELYEAIAEYECDMSPERLEHVIDELSDVQGTFTHFASLFGLNQQQMLHNSMDKVINRKTNPDYKRFGNFPLQEASQIVHESIFIPSDYNSHNDI